MATHFGYLLDPTLYPDYTRRSIKVPTWKTFDEKTQFSVLRVFAQRDGCLVDWKEELDRHVNELKLGRVIWPHVQTIYARNFSDLVAEIKRRRLYLFDIWGHVPGSATEAEFAHWIPPPGMVDDLTAELGDHFLGIDNGEQDGRYVGGYAHQQCPSFSDRVRQYLNFHRHFLRMGDDLGNCLSALVSLSFGHYFLKEGNHLLLGAETAQALPNSQIYYAFIRGAGKQYGVHWFGNASGFNRWGYKSYGPAEGNPCGPEFGTSLNLLKRLLYSHWMYNCVIVGFEQSWLMEENVEERLANPTACKQNAQGHAVLSPLGAIQAGAVRWVETHGSPGVMHAPVALLMDFFAGWAPPRHLYTHSIYQVWGGMPYEKGDYLTHAVLSLLYPGYEDASYYRDERGFISPTPHGDMADCLLSDAPRWVLKQYGLVIVAGRLRMTLELRDKLRTFVESGGHVVVTGAHAGGLIPGLELESVPVAMPAGSVVVWADGNSVRESHAFDVYRAKLPAGATVRASCDGHPLVVDVPQGEGTYTVLLSPFGLNREPLVTGPIPYAENAPLPCPYVMLEHAKKALATALERQQLFSANAGLSLITCRKDKGVYTLGVQNNGLQALPLELVSRCGEIVATKELALDQSEKGATGYWPLGFTDHDGGTSDDRTIAGGDVRIFEVRVREEGVACLPPPSPPTRPRGRMLALRSGDSIRDEILRRPTFFQHFDGVKVDWRLLRSRDAAQLKEEGAWLARQQARVVVDVSGGMNFYPDLTLLDTFAPRYEESVAALDDVLSKMEKLGSRDAVFSLHRSPENYCTRQRADERFLAGVRDLCRRAEASGVTLHLQHHPHKWHGTVRLTLDFIQAVGAGNLRFALNTGHAVMTREDDWQQVKAMAGDRLRMLLLSAPRRDLFHQMLDAHVPIASVEPLVEERDIRGDLSLPKDWVVFGPLRREDPVLPSDALRALPDSIHIAGQRIEGRPVSSVYGHCDLTSLLGRPTVGRTAYAFLRFETREAIEATFGFGADWWLQAWIDGALICDTTAYGNGSHPPSMHDHLATVKLTRGAHVLAVRLSGGSETIVLAVGGPGDLRHPLNALSAAALRVFGDVPQVLDADYSSQDEEYLDCKSVWED
ncbi:MAG: TIM barrel protein [Kiritimatiellae bacterium]|nr:TIM barrel protein [Kiritimatiellia bacterium]